MNSKELASSVALKLAADPSGGKSSSSDSSLKLWHYALLVGVPSAAVLAYVLYRRHQTNALAKKKAEIEAQREKKPTKSEFVTPATTGKPKEEKKSQKPKVNKLFRLKFYQVGWNFRFFCCCC